MQVMSKAELEQLDKLTSILVQLQYANRHELSDLVAGYIEALFDAE